MAVDIAAVEVVAVEVVAVEAAAMVVLLRGVESNRNGTRSAYNTYARRNVLR